MSGYVKVHPHSFTFDLLQYAEQVVGILGIHDWQIDIHVDEDKVQGPLGIAQRLPEYEVALIQLFPNRHDTDKDLYDTLRHELIHVLLHPLQTAEDILVAAVPDSEALIRHVFNSTEEMVVRALEKASDRLASKVSVPIPVPVP